ASAVFRASPDTMTTRIPWSFSRRTASGVVSLSGSATAASAATRPSMAPNTAPLPCTQRVCGLGKRRGHAAEDLHRERAADSDLVSGDQAFGGLPRDRTEMRHRLQRELAAFGAAHDGLRQRMLARPL